MQREREIYLTQNYILLEINYMFGKIKCAIFRVFLAINYSYTWQSHRTLRNSKSLSCPGYELLQRTFDNCRYGVL